MEFSPLYTRRLSGSSTRNSFNEDALEQLEFNINDISRASSPASVTSVSTRSEGHGGSSFRDRRHRSSLRSNDDDYRRRYSRLRGELDVERLKARQLQQERVEEMRKLREAYETDRKLELEDALEQLEFNINDISRASSPASVTSVSTRSEGHGGSSFRDRRHRSSLRSNDDDYRRRYSRLRGELDVERLKARQLQQERVEEMRKLREAYETDRKLELVALQNRLEEEKKKELSRLKEELIKQKDFELQQVLMYKGAEKMHKRRSTPDLTVKEKVGHEENNNQAREEKPRTETDEEDKFNGGKDGDNDVVVAPGKLAIQDGGDVEKKWRREGGEKSSLTWETRTTAVGSASVIDGAPSQEGQQGYRDGPDSARRRGSSRDDKDSAGAPSGIGNTNSGSNSSTRRKGPGAVGRSTEKVEKVDVATEIEDSAITQEGKSSGSRRRRHSERNQALPADGTSQVVWATKGVQATQDQDDQHTQTSGNAAREVAKHNETVKFLTERIKILESEKTAVERDKDETQKLLARKLKEHKIREEEFVRLKAGYDRELRTVINEHKKVALDNIEKLKLAESALKESTMSEAEIAIFSQRHGRERRLSTSSLPASQEQEQEGFIRKTQPQPIHQRQSGSGLSQVSRGWLH
ncbi:hypothetical protein EGW08_002453 [Elysia chlorotica]|uniref:Uncharacterized protein n=1 Tax=Elysia chlorotica TaxID=188477 RepID=A0A433U7C8_ELYCH|nr:hypothetical protein EGW08_002453 [Elysia chlorotica]